MSFVKWIKIVTNIFDDEKILLIESMPEADSLIVIWFKLLCMAGRINNGGVMMLNDKIAYTEEMLATIFRRPINTIRLALSSFENLGMIIIVNDTITIPNWSKHQSLDQLENKKQYMREYMSKYRKEQEDLAKGKSIVKSKTNCKTNSKANSKTNVNSLEGEVEKEGDIDKDIYRAVVQYLNEKADKSYKYSSKSTERLINARLNEDFSLDDFKKVIDNKVDSWKDDVKMNTYLRPTTLFGTKFESYLNEKTNENKTDYGW